MYSVAFELICIAILLGFATYRIAHMVTLEEGPYNIFIQFRSFMCSKFPEDHSYHWVASGFSCPYCFGFWVGFLFGLTFLIFPDLAVFVGLPFAVSGVALCIHRWVG